MVSRKIKILAEKKNSILVKRQAVFTTALLQQDLLACNTQNEPVAVAIASENRCTRCLCTLQVQNVHQIQWVFFWCNRCFLGAIGGFQVQEVAAIQNRCKMIVSGMQRFMDQRTYNHTQSACILSDFHWNEPVLYKLHNIPCPTQ